MVLFAEFEFVVADSELTQEFCERRGFWAGLGGEIGHCMESGIDIAAVFRVMGIESAETRVLLENAGFLPEMGEADPGGKAGKSAPDYYAVIGHFVSLFHVSINLAYLKFEIRSTKFETIKEKIQIS